MKFVKLADDIYRLKEVLSVSDFFCINNEFNAHYNNWIFTKTDNENLPHFGCLQEPKASHNTVGDNLTLIKYGTLLKYQCQKIIKHNLTLTRINTNIQFFGQEASFHIDGYSGWTLVLFVNPKWNMDWGGELVINTDKNNYLYAGFIPNDGILFPANLSHKGFAPNVLSKRPRKTVAFTYS